MKSKLFFCFTLIAGIAIGILSQRIPEVKAYTDEVIQPIETHDTFKQVKAHLGYADDMAAPEAYVQEESLPKHPTSLFLIHRPGYSVAYDARNRNPAWVYEHLTAENIQGHADASVMDVKEDEKIPRHLRATLADYRGKGLDRGQMASAMDHRANQEEINDTFYLTNICPQCPQLNRTYWSAMEKQIRELTKEYPHVSVITGPLYLPYQDQSGRFVKYRVIGSNDVAVPSHFFKVLVLEDRQGKTEKRAYILPNHEIAANIPLDQFKTTVEKVERAAGILIP